MSLNAQFALGTYAKAVGAAFNEFNQNNIAARIWEHDHTVWKPEPTEITNRLGWLHSPETMAPEVIKLQTLVTAVRTKGFTNVLLLGMGGSSLAPEVFYKTFGAQADGLNLAVVDTTDADAIQTIHQSVDLAKTVFIVATKSGGTAETLSAFKYFYNQVADQVGVEQAGRQFIAITDPGSKLVEIAQQYNFRETLINDPNIGGRYSVLSFFGLTAAALVGVDVAKLLNRAATAAENSKLVSIDNISAYIGLVMGELAKAGRDKVTFIASDAIASFGDWVEQL
ncbi:MAG: hypothetical protein GY943_17940, partial [Chloroflexi bacterium]|nr:hypothetical protein [Chloroflexota bacterium]